MPMLRFPKKALQGYLKSKVPDKELREAVSMIGTDVEEWGKECAIEIFPDRPDLLSVAGLGRALNHYLGFRKSVDTYSVSKAKHTVKMLPSAKDVRPHMRCAIIRGLKLNDERIQEIIEAQEKLHITFGRNRKKVAVGIYPLKHITFPVTYGAEKPGDIVFTPLEAEEEMDGTRILEEHPTGKKYAELLEGSKKYPVFRDADKNVLSMPPVINSETVGRITIKTKAAFLECTGPDERTLEQAITMLASMFAEMGARIEAVTVKKGRKRITTPDLSVQKMRISPSYIAERSAVPEKKISSSARKMGIQIKGSYATLPCYRTDFLHDADVVEDVVIGYGYENLEASTPSIYTVGKLQEQTHADEAMRRVLSGAGLLETMSFCIQEEGIPLANPLTADAKALRSELLSGLLGVLSKNTSQEYPQRIYEIGTIFTRGMTETKVAEKHAIAAVLCQEQASYTQARQLLETLSRAMGWKLRFREHKDPRFIRGRCARVTGTIKGVLGELHPETLLTKGITMPVCAFDVRIAK